MQRGAKEVEDWLIDGISLVTQCPKGEINPQASFASFGLESVVLNGLCFDLGRWLGCRVDPELIWTCESIRGLAQYLTVDVRRNGTPL